VQATLTRTRYSDNEFEYRHVQLPKAMLKAIPVEYHDKTKGTLKLLWEEEWRGMGITQVRCVTSRVRGRQSS
jgi:cyclin-dependent kinase regulatory subunit CKS1